MTSENDLTNEDKATLLVAGIEAAGLDVDTELDRINALPAGEWVDTVNGYLLAGMATRIDGLS